jgi:acetylornithine deacetylase/succinyl-diaminopimelate desuccinylase-like protein
VSSDDAERRQLRSRLDAHVAANRAAFVQTLLRYVDAGGVSATGEGIERAAEHAVGLLRGVGLEAAVEPGDGHPFVVGRTPHVAGAPTVLVYGHYDVQPAGPLEQWTSPPFAACVRDGRAYGRGTGDNKGQHLAHILGWQAWRADGDAPPANVVFLLDGEEEIGSPGLPAFVERRRDRLAADVVLWSDGSVHDSVRPSIDFGVRGAILFELHARDDGRGVLHSGNWGGVAPNPGWSLVQLLATMLSPDGTIAIDGFHDGIEPSSPAELEALAELEPLYRAAAGEVGVTRLAPPQERSIAERLVTHPTLTLEAMKVGDGGGGARPVVPNAAVAYADVRLVGGQRVEPVLNAIRRHVERHAPDVELVVHGSMEPSRTPLDAPFAAAVQAGLRLGTGREPLRIPAIGGALPLFVFTDVLGAPCFGLPLANADQANHAPDENIELSRFLDGIVTSACVLDAIARTAAAS